MTTTSHNPPNPRDLADPTPGGIPSNPRDRGGLPKGEVGKATAMTTAMRVLEMVMEMLLLPHQRLMAGRLFEAKDTSQRKEAKIRATATKASNIAVLYME